MDRVRGLVATAPHLTARFGSRRIRGHKWLWVFPEPLRQVRNEAAVIVRIVVSHSTRLLKESRCCPTVPSDGLTGFSSFFFPRTPDTP